VIQKSDEIVDNIIDRLLASQQQLTAVEKFSQRLTTATAPANESLYQDLIPLNSPQEGEQYAFEIDLDACSGCKACVAACHSLNGLDEGEIWRNVGLLTSGEEANPVVQHVTSACHHCLEPACMQGCPVRAYEKDPITGIVEHLDDQCIGCKYCMFTCPYDVPSYSKSKGIVRKCNMCVDRLRVGQAPACVQACPHQAIKIRTVKTEPLREEITTGASSSGVSQNSLVPGAPSSQLTFPTTSYLGRSGTKTGLPTDFHAAKPQHAHFPLVFMLTLTQLALGVFGVSLLFHLFGAVDASVLFKVNVFGFAALVAGLGVATLHLGRPDKAYRAMSGFRTSWLSREIIGFNLFAGSASSLVMFGFFGFLTEWFGDQTTLLTLGAFATGVLGVECSVMLYAVTGRPLWSHVRTHSLFFLTAACTGCAGALLICAWGQNVSPSVVRWLSVGLCVAIASKLFIESRLLQSLKSDTPSTERLSAELIVGPQRTVAIARLITGLVGGLFLPLLMLIGLLPVSLVTGLVIFSLVFAGEALERYLFFAVSVARRMPGAPN